MGRVKHKIRSILKDCPKPYYTPVYTSGTPVWKHNFILVGFDTIPSSGRFTKLPFDYDKTIIMVESGGYLSNESAKPLDQNECLIKQMRILPDLCFTLDFPIKAKAAKGVEERIAVKNLPEPVKRRAVERTIKNAKLAFELKDYIISQWEHEFEPVAIIQHYDHNSLVYASAELYSIGYEFFCAGGVATEASVRVMSEIYEILTTIRDVIGKECWIHLLGVSDVDIIKRVKNYIDSFDSSSLTMYAVYGGMMTEDGKSIGIGRKTRSQGASKYVAVKGQLSLTGEIADFGDRPKLGIEDEKDLIKVQELNFQNYMKLLKKELWKND